MQIKNRRREFACGASFGGGIGFRLVGAPEEIVYADFMKVGEFAEGV